MPFISQSALNTVCTILQYLYVHCAVYVIFCAEQTLQMSSPDFTPLFALAGAASAIVFCGECGSRQRVSTYELMNASQWHTLSLQWNLCPNCNECISLLG